MNGNTGLINGVRRVGARFRHLTVDGRVGAFNSSKYAGATLGGPPTTGSWSKGEWVVDLNSGGAWTCITNGTPGTWRALGNTGSGLFGDGSDGDVVFDGSTALTNWTRAGSVYTASNVAVYNYRSVTIASGVTVNLAGTLWFCPGLILNNGTVAVNGTDASVGTAGTGGKSAWGTSGSATGGSGGTGAGGGGSGNGGAAAIWLGGNGGSGGSGSGGGGGTPSTGSNNTNSTFPTLHNIFAAHGFNNYDNYVAAASQWQPIKGGISGGSGGGDGTNIGGGGGGGGGVLIINAAQIINNGTISANGGAGGTPSAGNCGGGGGGGGGVVLISTGSLSGNAPTASAGGAGGKTGTGVVGNAGQAGQVVARSL